MTARTAAARTALACLLTLSGAGELRGAELGRRSEVELVGTATHIEAAGRGRCPDLNCPDSAFSASIWQLVAHGRGWLSEHWGGELQLGATLLPWTRSTVLSDGGTHSESGIRRFALLRALVHSDWRWFAVGAGLGAEDGGDGFAATPAGSLRLGPRFLHLAGHYNDGSSWLVSDWDTVVIGIAGGFDLPRSAGIGSWNLWRERALRLEGWVNLPASPGTATPVWECGIRIIGARASLRVGWASAWRSEGGPWFYHASHSAAWTLGLALPLGGP